MADLTDKQKAFIEHYLTCWNATEAAKKAGYSERTAYSIGWENLRKPEIAEYIEQRLTGAAMSADEVLARLADQGRGDMRYFLEAKTYGKPVITLDKAQGKTHLIKKFSSGPAGVSIELYDAQAALQLLGRHYKLFTDVTESSHEYRADDLTERLLSKLHQVADTEPTDGISE